MELIQNAINFLSKGGILMVFIAAASVITVTLFVYKYLVLRRERAITAKLAAPLIESLSNGETERAKTMTDTSPCALSSIAADAMRHAGQPRDRVQEAISDGARREHARLNRFIPTVGAVASLAPLLGLLGTVTGMIQVFSRLADQYDAGAAANPGMLAGGIWEALLTTAAGLCVAIPAFLLHGILDSSLDTLMLEIGDGATRILDTLAGKRDVR